MLVFLSTLAAQNVPGTPGSLLWKIFPVLGGNSDIGFQFGLTGILTQTAPDVEPYLWTFRFKSSASVKEGPFGGTEFPVWNHFLKFDYRDPTGRGRLAAEVNLTQATNSGYYGLGNGGDPSSRSATLGSRYSQYNRIECSAYGKTGLTLAPHATASAGAGFRWLDPKIYPGSLLDRDLGREPLVQGLFAHGVPLLLLGFDWDTRDREMNPTRGAWLTWDLRAAPSPTPAPDLSFVENTVTLRGYLPIAGERLVLALRQMTDLYAGTPPLADLGWSRSLDAFCMLGGKDGVRGIPEGRFQGRIRLMANAELRAMPLTFSMFRRSFTTGLAAFFDAGRVWADFTPRPDLDGTDLGLHWGAGLSYRLAWGNVTIRFDAAYSPEAVRLNPSAPIFVYLDMTQTF